MGLSGNSLRCAAQRMHESIGINQCNDICFVVCHHLSVATRIQMQFFILSVDLLLANVVVTCSHFDGINAKTFPVVRALKN